MKFFLFAIAIVSAAQELPPVWATSDYARLHLGLNTPKLEHSTDPEYTPQALSAGIEGSVVLQVVINKEGRVAFASVLSPLPAGLDRRAMAAVKSWRFTPGVMDAEIVPVLMTADVLFKLPYKTGAEEALQQRKRFQSVLDTLSQGKIPTAENITMVCDLAAQHFLPAVGLLGQWQIRGFGMPTDVAAGWIKIRAAAAQNDARALLFLAKADLPNSWPLVRKAAFFGSWDAQQLLAINTEQEGDRNGAKWYWRMCAARGIPACEFSLGQRLVAGPQVNPNDFSQGVAWLELAKEHGYSAADNLYGESVRKLSSIQLDWVAALKPHLELRNLRGF